MRLLTLLAAAVLAGGLYQLSRKRNLRSTPGVSDYRLAERVRTAIAGTSSGEVDVRCMNGVVILRGTVGGQERDRLLAAALAVPGVVQVTNYLETEPVGDLGPMQSGIATGA